jgi:HEPN domain-containing protein
LVAEPRSGGDHAQLLGFHAQQAVEKMVKAVLARNEVSYERTHNIAYLLNLLDEASIPKPDQADNLPNLSPWAAEFRYSRGPEDVPDRPEMRPLVEQTKAWAESQLKGDYDSSSRPDSSAG